jgi:type I restriction enzyme M protein
MCGHWLRAEISTYLWVLTNRKDKPRKAKVQLIDARPFWVQMEKSLGNKRRRIGDPHLCAVDYSVVPDICPR